jgi:hypothetical protein
MPEPRFLLLSVPDAAKLGGTLRLLGAANSEEEIGQRLEKLDASVMGRIAVVEVKTLYQRRPAVENIPVETPLFDVGQ